MRFNFTKRRTGLFCFLILRRFRHTRRPDGTLVALFFVLYPLGRFFSEFLRGDARTEMWGLSLPQVFCVVAAVIAGGFLLRPRLAGSAAL